MLGRLTRGVSRQGEGDGPEEAPVANGHPASAPEVDRNADQAAVAAFRHVFDRHGDALRRYAARFVRSREAAEDLVQETYWRLWRVWPQLAADTNLQAYLYTSVRNHSLNHLRRQRAEERRLAYVTVPPFSEGPTLMTEGEAQIAAEEITAAVERVVAGMPRRRREIAALRLRDQLSTADIAARLGVSPRTVEAHIAKITRTLREQLPLLLR